MSLEGVNKIYFIGMGGIGMSAAAGLAKEQGFEVAGSDATTVYSPARDVLEQHDIEIGIGYSAERVAASNADVYVVSAGEDHHNPEVAWLIEHGHEYVSFCELLYELSQDKIRVVVSGTHGKSTTSGLLGHLLRSMDDSSFMVGAVLKNYSTNFYSGNGHYIVFEGDEYKSLFDDPTPKMHYYKADLLVLTNLEFDHPDVFADLDEIKEEFRQLIANLPDDGLVIYNADNQNLADVVYREARRAFTFGIHNAADMQAVNIVYAEGETQFDVINKLDPDNVRTEHYVTQLPGELNVYNALAALSTVRSLGFQPELVDRYLREYVGVKRRFDVLLEEPVTVVDDYAHHPTAVKETLEGARKSYFIEDESSIKNQESSNAASDTPPLEDLLRPSASEAKGQGEVVAKSGDISKVSMTPINSSSRGGGQERRLWAVFQPHTYSRTLATIDELSESFEAADQVLLAPMYAARESGTRPGITDDEVLRRIQEHQPHTRLVHNAPEALEVLKTEVKPGDVVIVMAVGSFNRLAYDYADWVTNLDTKFAK